MLSHNDVYMLGCSLVAFATFSLVLPLAIFLDTLHYCHSILCNRWPRYTILFHAITTVIILAACAITTICLYFLDQQSSNATSIAHIEFNIVVNPSFPSLCKAAFRTIICACTVCITMGVKGLYTCLWLIIQFPSITLAWGAISYIAWHRIDS